MDGQRVDSGRYPRRKRDAYQRLDERHVVRLSGASAQCCRFQRADGNALGETNTTNRVFVNLGNADVVDTAVNNDDLDNAHVDSDNLSHGVLDNIIDNHPGPADNRNDDVLDKHFVDDRHGPIHNGCAAAKPTSAAERRNRLTARQADAIDSRSSRVRRIIARRFAVTVEVLADLGGGRR
jgi:hypothetical protein